MAVPFYMPDESDSSQDANTPSNLNQIPQNIQQLPQIDNDMLVQALFEAIYRCSQGQFAGNLMSSSSISREHFMFPDSISYPSTPSTSQSSSTRNSFRLTHRRVNSFGSQSQYSENNNNEIPFESELLHWEQHYQQREEMEEFSGQIPHPKSENQKQKKSKNENSKSKITNFVISALQFVIDTLK